MLAIIMLSAAVLILVVAGAVLAFSKKDNIINHKNVKSTDIEFETKYDEVKYMYEKGLISSAEYEKQMKHIIN